MKTLIKQTIIKQYKELKKIANNVTTLEQIKNILPKVAEVEINYNPLNEYKGEQIEVIRYFYKNIIVYYNIINNLAVVDVNLTICNEDGEEIYYGKLEDTGGIKHE